MEETKKRLRASANAVLARKGRSKGDPNDLLDAILEAVAIEIVRGRQ